MKNDEFKFRGIDVETIYVGDVSDHFDSDEEQRRVRKLYGKSLLLAEKVGLYISHRKDPAFVAVIYGHVVIGATFITLTPLRDDDEDCLEYEFDIAVAKYAQGNGIGTHLVWQLEKQIANDAAMMGQNIALVAEAVTDGGRGLLASLGYKESLTGNWYRKVFNG